jgi:hypothetical protein
VDINTAWNNIRENIKISAQESQVIVNQSIINHDLMRNVQNWLIQGSRLTTVVAGPSEVNEDNMSNVRQKASTHSRNKKREYLKDKINKLESNSKNLNMRDLYMGINKFKKCCQPRTNLVKDERGGLLAEPHKILNRWKNYFYQLLNIHEAGDVRQT